MSTSAVSSLNDSFFPSGTQSPSIPSPAQAAWDSPILLPKVGPAVPLATQSVAVAPVKAVVPAESIPVSHASASSEAPLRPQVTAAPKRIDRFVRGETSEIWGLGLDRIRMDETIDAIDAMIQDRTPRYVITANLNFAMLVDGNPKLKTVTDHASLVLADGQPLVWRSRIGSKGRLPERIAGAELIYRLAERAAVRGSRIYFLGAEPGVAQRCADELAKLYPGLQVAGVQSPPYRKLNEQETQRQHQAIVDSRPDILLVAFGQPKGELWIHENYMKLGVPVSIQLGASFDFVAGFAKRAPKIWQTLGLEWAYRMLSDPGRLIPRYTSNASFLAISILRDWNDYVNSKFSDNEELNNQTQST